MSDVAEFAANAVMGEIRRIPMLSTAAMRLMELLQKGDDALDLREVEDIVSGDPGLAARVLSLANSVLYSRGYEISTISAALTRLGSRQILSIGLEASLQSVGQEAMDGYDMAAGGLWEHAVATSIAARGLSRHLKLKDSGTLHAAGLLHNFGRIAMNAAFGDALKRLEPEENESFPHAEKRVLGMDCGEASARLLEHWKLPREVVDAIRYFYRPDEAPDDVRLAAEIIHVANHISNCGGWGLGRDGTAFDVSRKTLSDLNLTPDLIDEILAETMIAMSHWRRKDELPHSDCG